MKHLIALILAVTGSLSAHAACDKPYIFFDLGNTLVDTKTYDFEKIMYMPGAYNYLRELKSHGYPLGMIVNIPESWGARREEKMAALKKFIADKWTDSAPMAWELFDAGILIPMKDAQRKPAAVLFEAAASIAARAGCPAIYEGEEIQEMAPAKAAGMKPYLAGSEANTFFLSVERIDEYARHLRH
ncbi:MAG: hypothetical protein HY074_20015 [Deltaproteobacteria bacterium]|nr:hypothetical protein [Deltaproteobacteria bacterium]